MHYPKNGMGTFTTGASNSNFIAMYMARKRILTSGLTLEKCYCVCSEDAHYSFELAADMLGLQKSQICKIATDINGKLDTVKLADTIEKKRQSGQKLFFVHATAGTTIKGAFDSAASIKQVIQTEPQAWLHLDAALGGCVLFSKKHYKLLAHPELADSFAFNVHKLLGVPLMCSMLLTKNKHDMLLHASDSQSHHYLFHHDEQSLGPYSAQCGRRPDVLKFWLLWLFYGKKGLGKRIDNILDLAAYTEKKIQEQQNLVLYSPRYFNTLCFYIKKPRLVKCSRNEWQLKIRTWLHQHGVSFVNIATIKGTTVIRLAISNADLEKQHIDAFFNFIQQANQESMRVACHSDEQVKNQPVDGI